MDLSIYLNKDETTKKLSNLLYDGTLSLFLGSGVSAGLGLPNWDDLINSLELELQLFKDPNFERSSFVKIVNNLTDAQQLQDNADRIKREFGDNQKFMDAIQKSLYPSSLDFNNFGNILHNELLTAIGALLIGSKRGNVKTIITLNFDGILEWFVNIYGYVTNIIYELPRLEGNEDIRIFHPHGFMPQPDLGENRSDFIIFGLDSVCDRLGNKEDLWFDKTRQLLRSGIFLFIGMSIRTFNDPAIRSIINSVHKEVKDKRPIGFWIIIGSLNDDEIKNFLSKNIIPIMVERKEDIPKFLLNIIKRKLH